MGKTYLSYSQLKTHAECGHRYFLDYVDDERIQRPKGLWSPLGSAVHHSIKKNLQAKMAGQVLEHHGLRASQEYDRLAGEEEYDFQGEDPVAAHRGARGMAIQLAELHARMVAPMIRPYKVEAEFLLDRGDYFLKGFIDCLERVERSVLAGFPDEDVVLYQVDDTKTALRAPERDAAARSLQLRVYALAVRELEGVTPSFGVQDYLMKSTNPVHHRRTTPITDASLEVVDHRAEALLRARETGSFPGAAEGAWWCSKKHCPHFSGCRFAVRPVSLAMARCVT